MTGTTRSRYGISMWLMRRLTAPCIALHITLVAPGCQSMHKQITDTKSGSLQYPSGDLPGVAYDELPSDRATLIQIADRIHRSSRNLDKLIRARTALKKIQEMHPNDAQMLWRLARVGSVLSQHDKSHAAGWAKECYSAGLQATKVSSQWVQGHYFAAACSGLRAQHEPGKASRLLNELIEHAEQAHELQPSYDTGGPRRTLGIIYTLAPPWPSGVGDLDEAIELLEQVNEEFPKCPLNAFYLAEAYRKADQLARAKTLYKRAYRLGKKGRFGPEGAHYRRRVESALYQLRRSD